MNNVKYTIRCLPLRSFMRRTADVAHLVERVLGKNEVLGSIPNIGSNTQCTMKMINLI
jgi:hypothetical protein